ncbi:MAG: beta-ketoacyl-ACP synthase II [bacterium]|jgi:3-oxoacyl-[acyl-carrier-protein] synthase II
MPRVVVTGIGILSCFGEGVAAFEEAIFAGKSGVRKIQNFDCAEFPTKIAAELADYDATKYMDPKNVKRYDRVIVAAVAASKMALAESGLSIDDSNRDRIGVFIGSGIGGLDSFYKDTKTLVEKGPRRISPFFIPNAIANMPSGVVAMETGAMGPNFSIVSACASSAHCIGEAYRTLRYGNADAIIVGGSECAVDELGVAGFCSMRAVTASWNDEPTRASRPFDAKRDGFVMGEGAAVFLMETLDHAVSRGAKPVAEIVGYGASADAFHITAPAPEGKGAQIAIRAALRDANLSSSDIGYINAHGTSTELNDATETFAIKAVFGEHASKLPVSSTKSMHGHLLGGAGAIEGAACILALCRQELPPTINYENPDPECDLDYVPNAARRHEFTYAMSNSFGFGGQNAVLVFKRWTGE